MASTTGAPSQSKGHQRRRQLVPEVDDGELVRLIPHPYTMMMPAPHYTSRSANSDENGFRIALKDGRRVKLARLHGAPVAKGVVLGNGQIWGTGTTSDGTVVHNVLNKMRPEEIWYSLALKATNLTQERIAAELFAPLDATHAVWITGSYFLQLLLSHLSHKSLIPYPTQSMFFSALSASAAEDREAPDLKTRWSDAMELLEREITLFGRLFRSTATNIVFALQPSLSWCDKPTCPQERELADLFAAQAGVTPAQVSGQKQLARIYAARAEEICTRQGIKFLDINTAPALLTEEWLFLDGGHLTDAGHDALARVIAGALA